MISVYVKIRKDQNNASVGRISFKGVDQRDIETSLS